jgi:hypothetical protein
MQENDLTAHGQVQFVETAQMGGITTALAKSANLVRKTGLSTGICLQRWCLVPSWADSFWCTEDMSVSHHIDPFILQQSTILTVVCPLHTDLEKHHMLTDLRIIIGLYQILGQCHSVLKISWPEPVPVFIGKFDTNFLWACA